MNGDQRTTGQNHGQKTGSARDAGHGFPMSYGVETMEMGGEG
jgi:hypothetical protein